MELERCRYIVVEGPIGAGKTTLAREIAVKLHAETLFERAIPAEYLARLADVYTRYFYRYVEAPLLIVNSERLNFVDNARHVDLLMQRIAGMRTPREFFNLGSG